MEGGVALSPSSWARRRAWARQSRCWRNTGPEEEEEATATARDVPELPPPHLDDVFLGGSPSSKIETWLQECGLSSEVPPEEPAVPGPHGCGSTGTSFEDDLTLGAEALLLPGTHKATSRAPRDNHLNLGHSLASSALSSLTTKTSSSISEVLEWRQGDAEDILYNLGFVPSEPGGVTSRVPPRFFAVPSRARGIDLRLFLTAQVRRLQSEDPSLTLASRFQQVQALAAAADAFFCLYCHVSRTPLQRIVPSRPACPCPRVPNVPNNVPTGPPQPVTLSPAQRWRKVVATMCLYTSPRDEDRTSRVPTVTTVPIVTTVPSVTTIPTVTTIPSVTAIPTSQSSSLGKGVLEVLERTQGDRFRFDPIGVPKSWGGDTGMESHQWGASGSPPVPPAPWLAQGVPPCPRHSGEDVPTCCGGELSPRPPAVGTSPGAAWGHLERCCPHGGDSGDTPMGVAQGDRDTPWDSTEQVNVTLSPTPGATRTWVTPGRLGPKGDTGFWGPPPGRTAVSPGCHRGDPQDPAGTCPPGSATPGAGGHRAQRRRGQRRGDTGWQRGDPPGGKSPSTPRPEDSFELEEVLSASEDEDDGDDDDGDDGDDGDGDDDDGDDDDGDSREEAVLCPHPSVRIRRRLMLHASSGRSDSSGFVEEPVSHQLSPALSHGTDLVA